MKTKSFYKNLFSRHPRAFYPLFWCQLLDSFSFFGFRSLLVLCMVQQGGMEDTQALTFYSTILCLAYALPVLGGILADRFLGLKQAIVIGNGLLSIGYTFLCFEGYIYFCLACAFIIVGSGFLRSNLSALLGKSYGEGDKRCEEGYRLSYMGVNLGSFLATALGGLIISLWGWRYGFALLTLASYSHLFVLVVSWRLLPDTRLVTGTFKRTSRWWGVFILFGSVLVAGLFAYVFWQQIFLSTLPRVALSLMVGAAVWLIFVTQREERRNLLALFCLMGFTMIFFAFFEQLGGLINLFIERCVDRRVTEFFEIPPACFQSLNPVLVLVAAPLLSLVWKGLRHCRQEPSMVAKFFLGFMQLGVGYGLFYYGTPPLAEASSVSSFWVVAGIFLLTTGELCVAPQGYYAVHHLAPKAHKGVLMGLLFFCYAASHYLAGVMGKVGCGAAQASRSLTTSLYSEAFVHMALSVFVASFVFLLVMPFLTQVIRRR